MIFEEYDYRFCVNASLQVLQEERKKICLDTICYQPTIYQGLHEFESDSLRKLYFQTYLVEWVYDHWNMVSKLLGNHREFSKDEQKSMAVFFAEYFSQYIDMCSQQGVLSKLAMPIMLESTQKILYDMIECSENWQENIDRLKADQKRYREEFRRLIESLECNKEEKL